MLKSQKYYTMIALIQLFARNLGETCFMPIYSLYITPGYNHVRCLHPRLAISLVPQTSSGLDCKVEKSPSVRQTYHHCETFLSRSEFILVGRERAREVEHETLLAVLRGSKYLHSWTLRVQHSSNAVESISASDLRLGHLNIWLSPQILTSN